MSLTISLSLITTLFFFELGQSTFCPVTSPNDEVVYVTDTPTKLMIGATKTGCAIDCLSSNCRCINYNVTSLNCSVYNFEPKSYAVDKTNNTVAYQLINTPLKGLWFTVPVTNCSFPFVYQGLKYCGCRRGVMFPNDQICGKSYYSCQLKNGKPAFCNVSNMSSVNTLGCSLNSSCNGSSSQFPCTCNAGYTGDGFNCTDIDECLTNRSNCSPLATCVNTNGSFSCTCNPGYNGNGFFCNDTNECSTNNGPCSSITTCTNTIGSFTCTCNSNYTKDGFTCSDWTYNYTSNTCYYVEASNSLSTDFSTAITRCQSMGNQTDLVSFRNIYEYNFVKRISASIFSALSLQFWTALQKQSSGAVQTYWVDGNPSNFSVPWAPGQPNTSEICLPLGADGYVDESCTTPNQYICEMPSTAGSIPRDCADIKSRVSNTSGVYTVFTRCTERPLTVYCDMDTTTGGWMVFQRRNNGSVDFYRNWTEYARGFGDVRGEHWIGNSNLYILTSAKRYKLRIDLADFNGNTRFAEYDNFVVQSASDLYKLSSVGQCTGNASDSLYYHLGQRFSTYDQDNDALLGVNCARSYKGAWWYKTCHSSNLNGYYYSSGPLNNSLSATGVSWYAWKGHSYSLKFAEMKIKPY